MSNMATYSTVALITGALIPLQLAFNSQLGGITKNPYIAALIVFLVGGISVALVVVIMRPSMPNLGDLLEAPFTVWFGGVIAAIYMLAIIIVTPKLGVGSMTILILAGQVFVALVLDHYGAFGNLQQSLNLHRCVGAVLVIAGVALIRTH